MAVAAKFIADFTSFDKAVDNAKVTLKDFGTSIGRVDKDLARFGDQFSGRKLIQDATLAAKAIEEIGGTSKLTQRELERVSSLAKDAAEKLRAMGSDVPPRMQALADAVKQPSSAISGLLGVAKSAVGIIGLSFSAGAIVSAISRTGEWAGHIDDLSKKMGISRDAVQRFDFAAKQNGSTVDAVGNAMAQMGKKLVEGDGSTVGALSRLNLTLADLQGLAPDQAFKRIASAINELPDPMQKSAAAMALLGRSGAELLPMFASLEADMSRAVVASDSMIEAGDKLGDAWDSLKMTGTGLLAGILVPFAPALDAAAGAAGRFAQAQMDLAEASKRAHEELQKQRQPGGMMPTGPNAGAVQDQLFLMSMEKSTAKAQEGVRKLAIDGLKPLTMSLAEADAVSRKLDASMAKHAKTVDKAVTAHQQWLDKSRELTTSLMNLATGQYPIIDGTGKIANAWRTLTPPTAFAEGAGILRDLLNPQLDDATQALQRFAMGWRGLPNAISEGAGTFITKTQEMKDGFTGAFESIGPTIVGALMGGGNVIASVGSQFGAQLTGKIFGPQSGMAQSITANFGSALGGAFNALLPGIGALLGPLLGKIGSFFKDIFGGPSAQEVAGRSAAESFRAQLESSLTLQQKLEAGNDKWKQSVIALRDAYLSVGATEAQALEASQALWAAEKLGPAAVDDILKQISKTLVGDFLPETERATALAALGFQGLVDYLDTLKQKGEEGVTVEVKAKLDPKLDAIMAFLGGQGGDAGSGNLDDDWSPGSLADFIRRNGYEDVGRFAEGFSGEARNSADNQARNYINDNPGLVDAAKAAKISRDNDAVKPVIGFATGTAGKYLDFGAGTPAMLHGRERVVTEAEGRSEAGAATAAISGVIAQLARLEQTMDRLPTMLRDASMTRVAVRA